MVNINTELVQHLWLIPHPSIFPSCSYDWLQFSSDVVGCNRDPATDVISVVDTWNVPSNGRLNTLDVTQDVVLFQGSFVNGRISCS